MSGSTPVDIIASKTTTEWLQASFSPHAAMQTSCMMLINATDTNTQAPEIRAFAVDA